LPPHLKRRKDRGSTWYLVDGAKKLSLRTTKKGLAEYRLRDYIKGKYGLTPTPMVSEYFDRWIVTKIEPLFRRSLIRDYNQHFSRYILPKFKSIRLLALGTKELTDFRLELLRKGLCVKTARNIIDGSFRALYRDARSEIDDLKGRDPFIDVHWPPAERKKPEVFSPGERDRILEFFLEEETFYYPWVLFAFHVGTRPSEASALIVDDVNFKTGEVSITKSRHLRVDNYPKTQKSTRVVRVPFQVLEALSLVPSVAIGEGKLFLNKFGDPLDANQWTKDYWPRALTALKIRQRKFYCTRHTFITEQVKRGENLKAIADYCGTSVMMIERDYCAPLTLSDRTILEPGGYKYLERVASPTGFEPVSPA
jgi:integrase